MSTQMPLLTIGLPVFNGARFLADALDGLLAQSFGDFVVEISDNASTDRTREISLDYAARDPRIRYWRADRNGGAAWNFNRVANAARTRYFAWHCADDFAHADHYRACVEALEARPDAVAAYALAERMDERGGGLPTELRPLALDVPEVRRRFAACLAPMTYSENVLYGVFRQQALARTRLFGAFGGSDRAFLAELSLSGPLLRIPQLLFRRRVPDTGRTEVEDQRYNSGGRSLSRQLREWRILAWHVGSVRRACVSPTVKAGLYAALVRRLVGQPALYSTELALAFRDFAVRR